MTLESWAMGLGDAAGGAKIFKQHRMYLHLVSSLIIDVDRDDAVDWPLDAHHAWKSV
jgi:hypothetical protein